MSRLKQQPSKSKKELWNLNDVVNCPDKISSTLGVILDATGCYKTNKSLDFVVKLRIIDDSFNPEYNSNQKLQSYIMIFLYFPDKNLINHIPKLGDVILLRNFIFDINEFKGNNYVTGSFNKSVSAWQIYEGNEGATSRAILKSKEIPKLFKEEQLKLDSLRSWRTKFFCKRSLLTINWYRFALPKNIDHYPILQLKDIDLLLKLVTSFKTTVNGETFHRLAFCDLAGVLHFCEINSSEFRFVDGVVYKLRSVSCIVEQNSKQKRLNYYEHSAILQIPTCFKDYQEFISKTKDVSYPKSLLETQFFSELHLDKYHKESYEWGVSVFRSDSKANNDNLKAAAIGHFPSLKDFHLDEVDLERVKDNDKRKKKICSVFMSKYAGLEITDLSSLDSILKKCKLKSQNASDYNGKIYRIRVSISEVINKFIDKFCQFLDLGSLVTWNISEYKEASKKPKDLQVIFNSAFNIHDKSIEKGKSMAVYLFTDDGNPQDILELWQVFDNLEDRENFLNKQEIYQAKLTENLEKMVHAENKFDLIVQFIEMEGTESYFKIIDTKFWFL